MNTFSNFNTQRFEGGQRPPTEIGNLTRIMDATGGIGANSMIEAERYLNEERNRAINSQEKLSKQVDDLMMKDLKGAQLIRDLESKYYDGMKTIENLKRENEKLREDYLKARDELNLKENHMEARINNLEFQLNEKDKEDKLILDKILTEHKVNVKELNSNWERRLEDLERRNQGLSSEKENLELELQRVLDSIGIIKQEHQMELKEVQDRIFDQEFRRYEDQIQALNSKIKLLEENREQGTRTKTEDGRGLYDRERKLQETLVRLEGENNQMKNEKLALNSQLADLRELVERLRGEIGNKDKLLFKLEGELAELHSLIQTSKDNHEKDLTSLMIDHKKERASWDLLREG